MGCSGSKAVPAPRAETRAEPEEKKEKMGYGMASGKMGSEVQSFVCFGFLCYYKSIHGHGSQKGYPQIPSGTRTNVSKTCDFAVEVSS